MTTRWNMLAALGVCASLIALTTLGCELLALADRTQIPLDDGPSCRSGSTAGSCGTSGEGGCVPQSCDQGTSCQVGACSDGSCVLVNLPSGTPCDSAGNASYCDDAGGCSYECLTEHPAIDPDCSSQVCRGNLCQLPACDDGIANGDETDVDCGGSCLPDCADGQGCNVAGDCVSRYCDTSGGGGSGGGGSGGGGSSGGGAGGGTAAGICAGCASDSDCGPDEFCGLSIGQDDHCLSKQANGASCNDYTGSQCASGFCSSDDAVCCDTACDALCQACVAAKTGGSNGVCGAIMANTDPDEECSGATSCNGSGECS